MAGTSKCTHLGQITSVSPSTAGCEECLAISGSWVHLRLCMSCGHVGCCDSSSNRHATRHYRDSGHPIVASLEPAENWWWCYPDQLVLIPEP
jgi:uncharacterized UBP type Zn finger protein